MTSRQCEQIKIIQNDLRIAVDVVSSLRQGAKDTTLGYKLANFELSLDAALEFATEVVEEVSE